MLRLYPQQVFSAALAQQQGCAVFRFSCSSQRSRGLQLAGRGTSSTCSAPLRSLGIDAQWSCIGRIPSLTSKVSFADPSSCTRSETLRMIAANLPAGIWVRSPSSMSHSCTKISDQASGLAPQSYRAPQRLNQAAHRGRRHLSKRGCHHPSRRVHPWKRTSASEDLNRMSNCSRPGIRWRVLDGLGASPFSAQLFQARGSAFSAPPCAFGGCLPPFRALASRKAFHNAPEDASPETRLPAATSSSGSAKPDCFSAPELASVTLSSHVRRIVDHHCDRTGLCSGSERRMERKVFSSGLRDKIAQHHSFFRYISESPKGRGDTRGHRIVKGLMRQ